MGFVKDNYSVDTYKVSFVDIVLYIDLRGKCAH